MRNVRIIVSCRSFDLDFDPKLSLLGRKPQIRLGMLDKEDVEKVLDRLKVGLYKEIDDKTKSILQTPQHLNLFCQVYTKNKRKDYYSITDLYDELWLQTIDLAEADIAAGRTTPQEESMRRWKDKHANKKQQEKEMVEAV